MFVKILAVLALATIAAARNFEGVDPNTLSCDPRGEEFLLLPHYTECHRFFVCDHGLEKDRRCAPGTIFDFIEQTCNHPWATKCWLRKGGEDIDGSGDDELWIAPDVNGPTLIKPQPEEFNSILNCNRADTAALMMPYKGDCQRYWRCVGGVLQTAYCSDGLFYNAQKQQCDFEVNVKCEQQESELDGEFIVYK